VRTAARNSIESPGDLKYVSAGNDSPAQRRFAAACAQFPLTRKQ